MCQDARTIDQSQKLQLLLRTTCLHKLCGMSAGICHVSTMWQVKLCPLKYLNTVEKLNLENAYVLKSTTVTCSLSVDACWTQFTNIQADDRMIFSMYYFHYEPIPIWLPEQWKFTVLYVKMYCLMLRRAAWQSPYFLFSLCSGSHF